MIKSKKDIDDNLIREATLPELKTKVIYFIKKANSKEELMFILINLGEDMLRRI